MSLPPQVCQQRLVVSGAAVAFGVGGLGRRPVRRQEAMYKPLLQHSEELVVDAERQLGKHPEVHVRAYVLEPTRLLGRVDGVHDRVPRASKLRTIWGSALQGTRRGRPEEEQSPERGVPHV